MNQTTAEPPTTTANSHFFNETLKGLMAARKTLSPKYFYDEVGSQYFDEICDLHEYYPYHTELKLLPKVAADLADLFAQSVSIVEFGAGSLHKIKPLLDAVTQIEEFIPIDISIEHLQQAARTLQKDYNHIAVSPVAADFCRSITLPPSRHQRVGFFPGSTIGNFTPAEATEFMRCAHSTLGDNAKLLIGVDTKKSPDIIHSAYNDSRGITAKFNLNILHRINRELGSDICVDNFEHYAFYDATLGRVEMHLVSLVEQSFQLGDYTITLEQGESIHTENSYKYNPQDFASLVTKSGWHIQQSWLAENGMFSMYLLHA